MNNLSEFLLARITEDERRSYLHKGLGGLHTVECGVDLGYHATGKCVCDGPLWVLRESVAKRQIIQLHEALSAAGGKDGSLAWVAMGEVLKHLATAYEDHPDYGKGWESVNASGRCAG